MVDVIVQTVLWYVPKAVTSKGATQTTLVSSGGVIFLDCDLIFDSRNLCYVLHDTHVLDSVDDVDTWVFFKVRKV